MFAPCLIHNSSKYLCQDCSSLEIIKHKIKLYKLLQELKILKHEIDEILVSSMVDTCATDSTAIVTANTNIEIVTLLKSRVLALKVIAKKREIGQLEKSIKDLEKSNVEKLSKILTIEQSLINKKKTGANINNGDTNNIKYEKETEHDHNDIKCKILQSSKMVYKFQNEKFNQLSELIPLRFAKYTYYFGNVPIPENLKSIGTILLPGRKTKISSDFLLDDLIKYLKVGLKVWGVEYKMIFTKFFFLKLNKQDNPSHQEATRRKTKNKRRDIDYNNIPTKNKEKNKINAVKSQKREKEGKKEEKEEIIFQDGEDSSYNGINSNTKKDRYKLQLNNKNSGNRRFFLQTKQLRTPDMEASAANSSVETHAINKDNKNNDGNLLAKKNEINRINNNHYNILNKVTFIIFSAYKIRNIQARYNNNNVNYTNNITDDIKKINVQDYNFLGRLIYETFKGKEHGDSTETLVIEIEEDKRFVLYIYRLIKDIIEKKNEEKWLLIS
ncbi:uncharacterized protein SCODWIG_03523 [Saccharomycodes ludwigii]|uniref:Uncharacterized protein n=1 Tax=Saccharomycodes ludwigii TaxID=36035 RepID=A0A376BAS1_9ASCO|nr:hypothetical protein SCDLUD_000539 [Saccharomycodes ludwigii]KAH3902940.1 hypothetical protein SCDLUD_000539 [Saccharomycodes ludwigii]SSD61762.1 uncharacterized protein SCODWIG_03523 [Saccharomycodes ludwigii]